MRYLFFFVTILVIVSGCGSNQSLELISASAALNNDEERLGSIGITTGERKGESIVPIALSYDIVLKNTSNKQLGNMEKINREAFKYDDGIEVYLEPSASLKEMSIEIIGVNIYGPDALGSGQTFEPILEPNQEGEYTFDFDLGALEENPDVQLAPTMDELEKLAAHALDVDLVVTIEEEEIARFDLSKSSEE